MLDSINNLTRFDDIDYLHWTDEEIYRSTFTYVLHNNNKIKERDLSIAKIRLYYPELMIGANTKRCSACLYKNAFSLLLRPILDICHLSQFNSILLKYGYHITYASSKTNTLIISSCTDTDIHLDNLYICISRQENLGNIGITAKNNLLCVNDKETNICMFPAASFVQSKVNFYDSIKTKSIELVNALNNTKTNSLTHYIYLVYRTPDRIQKTTKRVCNIDCIISKSNVIHAKYVELISDTDTTYWHKLPFYC